VFEVLTFTLTNFLAKIIFSRGYRGAKKSRNSGGVREGGEWCCYFSDQNMEIPGSRERGNLFADS